MHVLYTTFSAHMQAPSPPSIQYKHVLLPILDANSYLSDGSKLALKTAAQLAQGSGKVTVLVVDEEVRRWQGRGWGRGKVTVFVVDEEVRRGRDGAGQGQRDGMKR